MALEVTLTIAHPLEKAARGKERGKVFEEIFSTLAQKNSLDLVRNQTVGIYSFMYRWDMKRANKS